MPPISLRRALGVGVVWLGVTGLLGCAAGGQAAKQGSSLPTAQRLYTVGEQRFAAGRADQAVDLWRHAILQLPETSHYDDLRHQLILRRAYGQLVAHAQTSDRRWLVDGHTMLTRYLERHEAMFGGRTRAKAQRGEVYEILYEFETRLAAPAEPTPATDAGPDAVAAKPAALPPVLDDSQQAVGGVGPNVMQQHRRSPGIAGQAGPMAAAKDSRKLGRPVRDDEVRVVHVDTRGRPSVDDPATRAALRSWATEPEPWLTQPTLVEWIPPRPYVRVGGLARKVEGDRSRLGGQSLAHAVVRDLRPELRACYDEAFARRPDDVVMATIEFDVHADGRVVRPKIVEGGVVDPLGDACVLDRLAAARIEADPGRETTRVRVPLTFFYDGAVYKDEAGGGDVSTPMQLALPQRSDTPPRRDQARQRTDASAPSK